MSGRLSKSQKIAELEDEVAELQEFCSRGREQREEFYRRQDAVLALHPPVKVKPLRGTHYELRCPRCRTDEHHTWADENMMPWPCPTVQALVPQYVTAAAERDSEER